MSEKMKKVLNAASLAERIIETETKLCNKLKLENLTDKDVTTVYNPLIYAKEPHDDYLNKWCNSPKEVMFLGMNPGPFGMCQNGIPFGEKLILDWLKIKKRKIGKPEKENPNRPIDGMQVKRREVSGVRLWGLFKEVSKTPETFFKNCMVYNFIPLCFIGKSGKNIAPDGLKSNVRKRLIKLSGDALVEIIDILQIKIVVCAGKWTEACIREIKKESKLPIEVLGIMHPSLLNPRANKDYIGDVKKDLEKLNVLKYLLPDKNSKLETNGKKDLEESVSCDRESDEEDDA